MFLVRWVEFGNGYEKEIKGYGEAKIFCNEAKQIGGKEIMIWEFKEQV